MKINVVASNLCTKVGFQVESTILFYTLSIEIGAVIRLTVHQQQATTLF